MQYRIARQFPDEIFEQSEAVNVSLYVPTNWDPTETEGDKILFSNMIRQIEKQLSELIDKNTKNDMVDTLKTIKDDRTLWNQRLEGFGIFMNKNDCVIYIMLNPVNEIALVGQRFHTKPLFKDMQGLDEYQVLAIDRQSFTLYEGNRTGFRQIIQAEDEPRTIQDFLGDEYTESYLAQGSYGGTGAKAMFHGHKSKKDEVDKDIVRYLKQADKYIYDHYSKVSEKPLILFALPEYHHVFKQHSKNVYLLNDGIKKSPHELKINDLKKEAWHIIEPRYQEKIETLTNRYDKAYQQDLAHDKLPLIAKAAITGRVDTLIVEAFRQVPGRIDENNGMLIPKNQQNTKFDDALDDLIDIVYQNGGRVVVIPETSMPTDTGACAIYRF